jgi:hypothetical protein
MLQSELLFLNLNLHFKLLQGMFMTFLQRVICVLGEWGTHTGICNWGEISLVGIAGVAIFFYPSHLSLYGPLEL